MLQPLRTLRAASPFRAIALVVGVTALPLLVGLGLSAKCHKGRHASQSVRLLEVEILDEPAPPRSDSDDELQPDCEPTVHPYLASFSAQLDWLSEEQLRKVERIELKGTSSGRRLARVNRLGADRAVRFFTPLALDAVGRRDAATRLRKLDRIVDNATAEAAITALLDVAAEEDREVAVKKGDPESAFEAVAAAYEALQDVTLRDEELLDDDCASAYQTNPAAETASLAIDAGADRVKVEQAVVELVRDLRRQALRANLATIIQ